MSGAAHDEIGLLIAAAAFAADKHRDQRREDRDASPYINHPIQLAHVLKAEGGICDLDVLAAALLHDTVEDTDATPEEIEHRFGPRIAHIVMEVTDDKSLPRAERKRIQIERAPAISHEAKLIKLADKICNLRDLLINPPLEWSQERTAEYFDWAKAVIDGLRGTSPALEQIFDALWREHHRAANGG